MTNPSQPPNPPSKATVIFLSVVAVSLVLALFSLAGIGFVVYNALKQHPNSSSSAPQYEVPDNLSAQQYYELGVSQKAAGWPEQARKSLALAVQMDPTGETGQRAKRFMETKLPRYPVTPKAEQGNIQGYNEWHQGDLKAAEATFLALIEEYPDFEWPYGNLGRLYVEQKRYDEAHKYLEKAININPQYLNGWIHLSALYEATGDKPEMIRCLKTAARLDPEDKDLQRQLDFLE